MGGFYPRKQTKWHEKTPWAQVSRLIVETVGNYVVAFTFSDGHHTGIYPWELLRALGGEQRGENGKG